MNIQRVGEFDGSPVDEIELVSDSGVKLNIMTYGVVVRDWQVPVGGELRHVGLGFEDFSPYPEHSPYFGAVAGRVANRIGGAQFTLNGKTHQLVANEGPNQLHGGPKGLGNLVWEVDVDSATQSAKFTHRSLDGAMGYPGNVDISVTYRLEGDKVHISFFAQPDAPTPISLVQHHYFNLGTGENVLDHRLLMHADRCTPTDESLLPTGEILNIVGTDLDFQKAKTMRRADGTPIDLDVNMVLAEGLNRDEPVAQVLSPDGDVQLKLFTDQDGVQLYNAVMTNVSVPGFGGKKYGRYSGFCLEDQAFPNAVNTPSFPSIICTPDAPYRHECTIEIGATA